jgi:hypothetical protein
LIDGKEHNIELLAIHGPEHLFARTQRTDFVAGVEQCREENNHEQYY